MIGHESIADDRADWMVDAVAMATQHIRLLKGEPEEDKVLTDAIFLNCRKAILEAFKRAN